MYFFRESTFSNFCYSIFFSLEVLNMSTGFNELRTRLKCVKSRYVFSHFELITACSSSNILSGQAENEGITIKAFFPVAISNRSWSSYFFFPQSNSSFVLQHSAVVGNFVRFR